MEAVLVERLLKKVWRDNYCGFVRICNTQGCESFAC